MKKPKPLSPQQRAELARRAGVNDGISGLTTNPYTDPAERIAWSQGYREGVARRPSDEEGA